MPFNIRVIILMKVINMDNKTTIEELKTFVTKFCIERDWQQFHNPKDLAIGITTEASELLERFRFKSNEQIDILMKSTKRSEICDEVADIFYFTLLFAGYNNIDLASELKRKLEDTKKKYPIDKVKGNNKKYDEYEN